MKRSIAVSVALLTVMACSNASQSEGLCMTGTGGPVSGAADAHCGSKVQSVSVTSCHADEDAGAHTHDGGGEADAGMATDGGGSTDSGMPMDDGGMPMEHGDTMFGTEGDDDDCKIHMKWSATDVCQNATGTTFTVTATTKSDGKPFTGGAPFIEAFLDDGHPAPSAGTSKEVSPGVYTVGPVKFDAKGQWTVRFHFYSECDDAPAASPHTHGAFFVAVP